MPKGYFYLEAFRAPQFNNGLNPISIWTIQFFQIHRLQLYYTLFLMFIQLAGSIISVRLFILKSNCNYTVFKFYFGGVISLLKPKSSLPRSPSSLLDQCLMFEVLDDVIPLSSQTLQIYPLGFPSVLSLDTIFLLISFPALLYCPILPSLVPPVMCTSLPMYHRIQQFKYWSVLFVCLQVRW